MPARQRATIPVLLAGSLAVASAQRRGRARLWRWCSRARPTAIVSLGDSFISGEGGRWLGNGSEPFGTRSGTDRAAIELRRSRLLRL